MISLDQAVAFGLAAGILIVIPGPSVVFVIGRALSYGRGVALASVLGNTLGLLVIMLLLAAGLGVIVAESILVFTVIKIVGAAYLVWLGFQAIRHRSGFTRSELGGPRLAPPTAVRQGFVVGVSNPKAFMIFGALLPQFVDRGAGHIPAQLLQLGIIAVVLGFVLDSVWALAASRVRTWFTATPRRGEAIGAIGGVSMVGLGVALAVSDHR
ncbi:LysE family translocator [Nocardioides sp. R-C-SC26]|uniref:LysE family translocator n=1 Tax=Nocardioides sp. R-C-SC26 TaxID=2870414 RepID=UPI001E361CFF|nr:LysE family translocator [Nocardioides sp. R-C-SC26]